MYERVKGRFSSANHYLLPSFLFQASHIHDKWTHLDVKDPAFGQGERTFFQCFNLEGNLPGAFGSNANADVYVKMKAQATAVEPVQRSGQTFSMGDTVYIRSIPGQQQGFHYTPEEGRILGFNPSMSSSSRPSIPPTVVCFGSICPVNGYQRRDVDVGDLISSLDVEDRRRQREKVKAAAVAKEQLSSFRQPKSKTKKSIRTVSRHNDDHAAVALYIDKQYTMKGESISLDGPSSYDSCSLPSLPISMIQGVEEKMWAVSRPCQDDLIYSIKQGGDNFRNAIFSLIQIHELDKNKAILVWESMMGVSRAIGRDCSFGASACLFSAIHSIMMGFNSTEERHAFIHSESAIASRLANDQSACFLISRIINSAQVVKCNERMAELFISTEEAQGFVDQSGVLGFFGWGSFFAPECLGMIMKALSVVICSTDPRPQVDTIVKCKSRQGNKIRCLASVGFRAEINGDGVCILRLLPLLMKKERTPQPMEGLPYVQKQKQKQQLQHLSNSVESSGEIIDSSNDDGMLLIDRRGGGHGEVGMEGSPMTTASSDTTTGGAFSSSSSSSPTSPSSSSSSPPYLSLPLSPTSMTSSKASFAVPLSPRREAGRKGVVEDRSEGKSQQGKGEDVREGALGYSGLPQDAVTEGMLDLFLS